MNNTEIEYWSNFYNKKELSLENSNFSIFTHNYITKNIINNFNEQTPKLLDIGCGNGKDTYYLSKYYNCIGIDTSFKPKDKLNCKFYNKNFIEYDKTSYNFIYSRFTLHSITDDLQVLLLDSIKSGTYLFIETRSDKGINTNRIYGDNHYRNFTNYNKIKQLLLKHKFEILYEYEGINCAIYKEENPICIRLVCYKK